MTTAIDAAMEAPRMSFAPQSREFTDFQSVKLTDAHNNLGQIVDACQLSPVILQKHRRNRAAVVSIEFLELAIAALHGNREIIVTETMTDEQKARLEASRPSDAEIAADQWDDATDPATEARRRAELRLPFRP